MHKTGQKKSHLRLRPPGGTLPLQNPLVVLIDDEPANLDLLEMIVSMCAENVRLVKFSSAREAMPSLPKLKPDLLISDINNGCHNPSAAVPFNGRDMLTALARAKAAYPILIVSGGFQNRAELALARRVAGRNPHVTFWSKPCNLGKLIRYVRRQL